MKAGIDGSPRPVAQAALLIAGVHVGHGVTRHRTGIAVSLGMREAEVVEKCHLKGSCMCRATKNRL